MIPAEATKAPAQTTADAARQLWLYETALSNTPDFVYIFDLDGRFIYANDALLIMWGKTAEEALGRNCLELGYPDWHAAMHDREIKQVISTRAPFRGEIPFTGTHGRRIYEYIFNPVFDANQQVVAVAGTTRDITERKLVEDKLQTSEERLSLALEASQLVGIWDWDVLNDRVYTDARFAGMYGVDPQKAETGIPFDEFFARIHPEDVARRQQAIDAALRNDAPYSAEFRLLQEDGSVRWVHSRGRAHFDEAGRAVRFPGITVDITAEKKVSHELIKARNAAEAANIAKTEFLTNMSHEIRTPMNSVVGLAHILASSQPLTAQQKNFIETLRISADTLLGLINDLLDIAKIESRHVDIEQIPFSFGTVVQEVASLMEVRAQEKGLAFGTRFVTDALQTEQYIGDPARVRQVLMNLCSNAIKFTESGHVDIMVAATGTGMLSIRVSDTGIGVPADKHAAIFEKFSQADSSINRKYGGTGLGLTISKMLVEMMGGTITLQSVPQEGTCFEVLLPLVKAPTSRAFTSQEIFMPHAPIPTTTHSHRILLVEDYAPNVLVARTYLEQFGYQCDVASNGEEAIDKVKNGGYSVVLMDVQMHGMSGLEATSNIRMHEQSADLPRVPIIGMTAHALMGDRERCLAAGMDDYLSKPFNPNELKEKLEGYLAA